MQALLCKTTTTLPLIIFFKSMQQLEFKSLKNLNVNGKKVILRVDINVPVKDNKINDDTRIKSVIPTIRHLANQNSKVILIAHFGRPEGKFEESMSLRQLLSRLQELLNPIKISFVDDCIGKKVVEAVNKTNFGEIIMLENLRFYKQETECDPEFSKHLADLGEIYVNDAFSCSHRAHASITGISRLLPAYAGFLMTEELENLENLLRKPNGNVLAVVGGAKVSTKIDLLRHLSTKANTIFIAGGMANSFLYAQGFSVGKSLCEKELAKTAQEILAFASKNNCQIVLPTDLTVAKKFEISAPNQNVLPSQIKEDDLILDIGAKTSLTLQYLLETHQTLVWNGPLGAFEVKPFDRGTNDFAFAVAKKTKEKKLISVAGGGDVVSAINSCNLVQDFSYISTAGGAFLEWLEGKTLPGISALAESH